MLKSKTYLADAVLVVGHAGLNEVTVHLSMSSPFRSSEPEWSEETAAHAARDFGAL